MVQKIHTQVSRRTVAARFPEPMKFNLAVLVEV